jgi:uncharacterized protein
MTLQELQERREEILRIADKYGIRNVRVFGSVARGTQTPESDIDLLVDAPPEIGLKIGGFLYELQESISPKVQIQTEAMISPYFRSDVLREAIRL